MQDLATAPAATAALQSTTAQPAATQPAPTAIATNDDGAFLRSIGVGAPSPTPAAQQPVQAAQSGLPDTANEAVTPSSDESDEELDTSGENQ